MVIMANKDMANMANMAKMANMGRIVHMATVNIANIGTSMRRSSGRHSGVVVRAVDCWQ